jgi:hypothetical protein
MEGVAEEQLQPQAGLGGIVHSALQLLAAAEVQEELVVEGGAQAIPHRGEH